VQKVSVIRPCLNSARYQREVLDSVDSQSLRDIEILDIDAGSTDGTAEILSR
jgi:glycosyltransferase involved in cell wall biosynthesis